MSDDKKIPNLGAPLDPTRDGEDVMGDTTGRTGVTINKPQQSQPSGSVLTEEGDKRNAEIGLSSAQQDRVEDIASEPSDKETDNESPRDNAPGDWHDAINFNLKNSSGDDSPGTDDVNTSAAGNLMGHEEDEQSVSGSAPAPESDDDTLANAQAAGSQIDEDEEHPKELDLGSDIDKAEIHHRTH